MSGGAGTCSSVGLSRDVLRCGIEQRHAQVQDRAETCPGVGLSRDMLRCRKSRDMLRCVIGQRHAQV